MDRNNLYVLILTYVICVIYKKKINGVQFLGSNSKIQLKYILTLSWYLVIEVIICFTSLLIFCSHIFFLHQLNRMLLNSFI